MINALTEHIEFDALFGRILTVADCSGSEELASKLDVECGLFDHCRKTGSVPLSLLILISYKLDVSLRCLYDTDCSELFTTKKRLEAARERIKQHELEVDQLQRKIAKKNLGASQYIPDARSFHSGIDRCQRQAVGNSGFSQSGNILATFTSRPS